MLYNDVLSRIFHFLAIYIIRGANGAIQSKSADAKRIFNILSAEKDKPALPLDKRPMPKCKKLSDAAQASATGGPPRQNKPKPKSKQTTKPTRETSIMSDSSRSQSAVSNFRITEPQAKMMGNFTSPYHLKQLYPSKSEKSTRESSVNIVEKSTGCSLPIMSSLSSESDGDSASSSSEQYVPSSGSELCSDDDDDDEDDDDDDEESIDSHVNDEETVVENDTEDELPVIDSSWHVIQRGRRHRNAKVSHTGALHTQAGSVNFSTSGVSVDATASTTYPPGNRETLH